MHVCILEGNLGIWELVTTGNMFVNVWTMDLYICFCEICDFMCDCAAGPLYELDSWFLQSPIFSSLKQNAIFFHWSVYLLTFHMSEMQGCQNWKLVIDSGSSSVQEIGNTQMEQGQIGQQGMGTGKQLGRIVSSHVILEP